MKKIKSIFKSKNFQSAVGMFIGTIIYCLGVVWVLNLGEFFGGGVTGISQIISTVIYKLTNFRVSISILVPILNIPLFLIGWKGVSKRFAILTLGSVVIQSVVIAFLEFLYEKYSINPFAVYGDNGELIFDMLTLSILGGLICGVGLGITLRFGASTGGVDIISQYFSFKRNIDFAKLSLIIDLSIIAVTCLLPNLLGGVEVAVYTVIRFIISVFILDKIHTIYKTVKITIVTTEEEEMRDALISRFNHGLTIFQAIGGYTKQQKWVIEAVVSSYEVEEYRHIAYEIDKNVFITYTEIKGVDGRFNKRAYT